MNKEERMLHFVVMLHCSDYLKELFAFHLTSEHDHIFTCITNYCSLMLLVVYCVQVFNYNKSDFLF